MKSIWKSILAAALAVGVLCACAANGTSGGTDTTDDTSAPETTAPAPDLTLVKDGATDYVIVRGDNSPQGETNAAVFLRRYMEKCGVKIKITTDWEGNGKAEHEIVVGTTLRTAEEGNTFDAHSVGEEGYYAVVKGERIYIGGGSVEAAQKGVEAFLTEFFGYAGDPDTVSAVTSVTVPADYAHITRQTYALEKITIMGKDLSEYKLVVTSGDSKAKSAAESIQQSLYSACGAWVEIVGKGETWNGPSIILSGDKPSKAGSFEVKVEGGNLVMKTDVSGGFSRGYNQFYRAALDGKTGTVALDAKYTFDSDIGSFVSYSEFGAVGDGVTDDFAAIVKTHEYANANGMKVKADAGATYYIGVIKTTAVIRTDTDWTGAKFIIDDSVVNTDQRNYNIFTVRSLKEQYSISGLTTLKKGQANLGITLKEPAIVVINDSNTKRYIREGINKNNGSDQTDIVLVDTDGNIDQNAPLIWDYKQVTSAYAIPIDTTTLTITGGEFTTIANQADSYYTYYTRGIQIQRSNVTVDGLKHYIVGELDHGAPYSGILQISNCANILVKDCTFTAHKTYQSKDPKQASMMGSYDISPSRAVNITFQNCVQTTDILDTKYWGVMGSNFCKNITLDGCTFSRFDAHQGVANVTIKNSTLGHQCLNAIGCGTLTVEGSTLYGSSFIYLRSDYGSTWEGDVVIKDCTWIPNCGKGVGNNAVIGGSYTGFHDFGYECYMPKSITIDGLHIVDTKRAAAYKGIYLLGNITPSYTSEAYEKKVAAQGYPYHITENITIKNFTSESGKKWNLSQNKFMYRNVVVNDLDAAN